VSADGVAITLDVDWAPDAAIDAAAERLLEARVPATWFLTHDSPAVERLRKHPELFELGLHPNFLPGSTQGSTPDEVLDFCMRLAPGATSFRTHGLVQSTPLLDRILARTPLRVDVSIFLPHARCVEPLSYWWQGRRLVRLPYFWEDDFEMERPEPCWSAKCLLDRPGLRIFDFHPIHVALNSSDLSAYQDLKRAQPELARVAAEAIASRTQQGEGAGSLFAELVAHCAAEGDARWISKLGEIS
jgi:hypothetical protein